MNHALWRSADVSNELVVRFASKCRVSERAVRWLLARGVPEHELGLWLAPDEQSWSSPWVFDDMRLTVDRLVDAVRKKEIIGVIGDYDVDGVTASAILCSTLDALGARWHCLIPHRISDGYGLSVNIVERADALGCSILITVDNGIRAHEAITHAVSAGMTVLITDHHEPDDELPTDAYSVVHWSRAEDKSVRQLSGAGVAWKVACALLGEVRSRNKADAKMSGLELDAAVLRELAYHHFGWAALGAIADLMPLEGENRKLVRKGLAALRNSIMPGWLSLCKAAKVDGSLVNEESAAWKLIPRLNAAGRMGDAQIALELLLAKDSVAADRAIEQISVWHEVRRSETDRAASEAASIGDAMLDKAACAGLVIAGPWPLGVVGIVAAKLVDRWNCPVIVLADDGGDLLKGSGRAPEGFPLHTAVETAEEWLHHFGGHEAAIGCAVERHNVLEFQTAFANACGRLQSAKSEDELKDGNSVIEFLSDDYLPLSEMTLDTVKSLDELRPFGPSNPPIRFYVGPVEIVSVTMLGNGAHTRIKVREGELTTELLWFQAPKQVQTFAAGRWIAVVGTIAEEFWRGTSRIQFRVDRAYDLGGVVTRSQFANVYRLLRARRKIHRADFDTLGIDVQHMQVIFDTFVELGFAHLQNDAYHVDEQAISRDLRDARRYQSHLQAAVACQW